MDNVTAPRARRDRLHRVIRIVGALLGAALTLSILPGSALAHRRARPAHARRHVLRHDRRAVPRSTHPHGRRPAPRHRVSRRRHAVRPACRGAFTPIRHTPRSELRRTVLCLIDHERRRHGLPALRASGDLDASAQRWTQVMVTHRDFSHGADFSGRISATGFDWSRVGENIATGYRTPAAAVRAWMRSTGHCENILDPMFLEAGMGVDAAPAATGVSPGTWTLDLGLGMYQRANSDNWGPAAGCPYAH